MPLDELVPAGAPRKPKPKVDSAPSATANHTKPGGAAKIASARKSKVQANADKVAAINARREAEAAQVAERVEQAKARLAASPVQPADGKVERMQLASAEAKALKAWTEGGEQGERPATPNLDAIEAKAPARKATAAAKATTPRKQATASVTPTEGQQTMTCKGACGKAKPITKFPTTTGGKRGTECRECRVARRAAKATEAVAS